jgi:DNA polymerase phi
MAQCFTEIQQRAAPRSPATHPIMTVSKDHYYRLASNLPQERIRAASALIGELQNVNAESEYKYALNRLISGLASGHDSARPGYSMCLTELLSLLVNNEAYPYSAQQFLQDLNSTLEKIVTAKHKGKNLRAYLFAKIFGIQSLINSELLTSADHLELKIIDELFEVALTKSWIRETAIVTLIKLIQKFELTNDAEIIPYILSKLASNSLLLSMDGLLIYLTIPVEERQSLTELANIENSIQRWKNDNPLTKGNLPLLKDALQDRIIFNPEEEEESEQQPQGGNKKKGKSKDKDKEANKIQKGSWTSQLHCVWAPLLSELVDNESHSHFHGHANKKHKSNKKIASSSDAKSLQLSLSTFWPTFDNTFFSHTASPERKHTGLQVLELTTSLPAFQPTFYQIVLDTNVSRVIVNHLAKKDRVLHSLSTNVVAAIVASAKAKSNTGARLELVRALEKQCVLFDRLTRTKTVRDLISNIHDEKHPESLENSIEQFQSLAHWLCEVAPVELASKDGDNANDIYPFALDFSLNLVRGNKSLLRCTFTEEDGDEDVSCALNLIGSVKQILGFVSSLVYTKKSQQLNENTVKVAKDRLESILADLMETCKGKVDWAGMIVEFLNRADDEGILNNDVGEDDELKETKMRSLEIWSSLYKEIRDDKENENENKDKDKKKEDEDMLETKKRLNNCLVMLFSTGLMELYGGDPESFGILSDLISMYDEIKVSTNEGIYGDMSNVLNTLVDLMLSYLTQKSGMKKKIGSGIWDCVVHIVGEAQLMRLFEVLLTRENKMGMEKLFNQEVEGFEEDEGEDGDGDEDDDDNDEDEDEEDAEDEEEDDGDDEEDDASAEDPETDKKSEIEEVEKSTTSALAKALNVPESDDNNNDDDDEDDDEDMDSDASVESMSDEQMMAIDHQLSAIFQQRQNSLTELKSSKKNGNERKLEAKEARELMALCKLRVIELLETFNSLHPKKCENMEIAKTLLLTMQLTVNVNVGEKAHKLIKKMSKQPFDISEIVPDIEHMDGYEKHMEPVFVIAQAAKFNALSQACSQVLLYYSRSLYALTKGCQGTQREVVLKNILDVYQGRLLLWTMQKTCRTGSAIFIDLINWLGSIRGNAEV